MQDAEGDPIRKAALIADMVQSVSVIPDPIQRSVYIKECARIMDIDEQILISEVARKRMTTSGDRETDEFLRRQTTLRQREAQQPGVEFVKQVEAGSSFETLEREIVKYLLKYGHCSFDFKEGRTMVACNVAEVIFAELSDDNIEFRNPVYAKIMNVYREQWTQLGTGVEVPAHVFLNHIDPEVCNMSVDILTADDNYVLSELWRRKEIHLETDAEMLAVGVPKAVTLYKSKVVEALIKELQAKLDDELPDDEQKDIMQRLHPPLSNQGRKNFCWSEAPDPDGCSDTGNPPASGRHLYPAQGQSVQRQSCTNVQTHLQNLPVHALHRRSSESYSFLLSAHRHSRTKNRPVCRSDGDTQAK